MERLWRPEGVNILKGQVRVEWVEWGHMAVENTGEHWRILGRKFYITKYKYRNIKYFIQYIPFLQEYSNSCGIQSHSGGFQWIPVDSSHSCRNVGGIKKYCFKCLRKLRVEEESSIKD